MEQREWKVYIRLWCVANILRILSGLNPHTALKDTVSAEPKLFLLAMIVLTLIFPRIWKVTVAMRIVTNLAKGPWMGNSQLWATMMDISLYLKDPTETIKAQLFVFYAASAFWKLNSSFLNPQYSCASLFCLQPLEYLPETCWKYFAPTIVKIAPIATLLVEFAVVYTGPVLFHLAIALTPPPSNVSSFGVTTCTRLFFWAPEQITNVFEKPSKTTIALAAAAPVLALALVHPLHSSAISTVQGSGIDMHLAYFTSLAVLLFAAGSQTRRSRPVGKRNVPLVSVAFVYAFILPILGLQEKGGCLMFSQLRMHGGSNHYLLPTALLQKYYYDSDPRSALAGGVARITSTNLTNLGNIFAEHMSPRTLRLVRNEAKLESEYIWPVKATHAPRASPPPRFFQFTLSNLGLRRLLQEYRGPFTLTYHRLSGPEGDEHWRTTKPGEVHVVEKLANGTLLCDSCDSRELALISPPTKFNFLTVMLLPQVNPIVPNRKEEMHCVTWG